MKPTYSIIYNGVNVTKDFTPILETIEFTEYLENKASEVSLTLSNAAGHFFEDWYPQIEDTIAVKLGYEEGMLMDCGEFSVDDITLNGSRSGDFFTVRALSASPESIHSEKAVQNYQGKTISYIVNKVAGELGYSVKGDLDGTWTGIQNGTGLQFLEQLSRQTGRIMKVEGETLIFFKLEKILTGPVVATIQKGDEMEYNITDKAAGRYTRCTVKWWDTKKKQLISGTYDAGISGGGTKVLWEEVESAQSAKERAKDWITDANKPGIQFTVTLPGDVGLCAGVVVKMSGFGRYDVQFYVAKARHSINRNRGYITELTLQK